MIISIIIIDYLLARCGVIKMKKKLIGKSENYWKTHRRGFPYIQACALSFKHGQHVKSDVPHTQMSHKMCQSDDFMFNYINKTQPLPTFRVMNKNIRNFKNKNLDPHTERP